MHQPEFCIAIFQFPKDKLFCQQQKDSAHMGFVAFSIPSLIVVGGGKLTQPVSALGPCRSDGLSSPRLTTEGEIKLPDVVL